METYLIENFSFTYPGRQQPALRDIDLAIEPGQFVTLLGPSGGGKSTLLRQLKTVLAPHGMSSGRILFQGRPLAEIGQREQAGSIGFVQQSPDNQIVTDKVWHELAFGLESLGLESEDIRLRVAEMASFFGIQTWFHQPVSELSGGQKQLLNLAAVMVMQPAVLILDEPTSQLDPIAATDFLDTLAKINRELGTTILISEHRLEEALPLADRALVLDAGRLIVDASPKEAAAQLKRLDHHMFAAMPTPIRVWSAMEDGPHCPLTVREGRGWLIELAEKRPPDATAIPADSRPKLSDKPIISLKEVSFSYAQGGPEVVNKLSLDIYPGQLYALVGGNGVGKTTVLSLISGLHHPQRGQVLLAGRDMAKAGGDIYNGLLGVLPQNPQALFVKKTVEADLYEMFKGRHLTAAEQQRRVAAVTRLCELDDFLAVHPYDLSGGEQQRAALAKVLLMAPKILLLDEPTKGLDGHFKLRLAAILKSLQALGVTIVLVSHDIEFCAAHADRCALMFDGAIVARQGPRAFFSGQRFYTTAAHRMAGHLLPRAVLADDILLAFGGKVAPAAVDPPDAELQSLFASDGAERGDAGGDNCDSHGEDGGYTAPAPMIATQKLRRPSHARQLSRRTWLALAMILLAIPLTIYVGVFYLGDRKYYFISLLIILETLLPFVLVFEDRKPQARELVVVAVLVALAVAGRAAFFMLPGFKPVLAIVIIAGITFGGETGFLVGAMTGFVSNFFFGQGPWTPWQMFAYGVTGFIAGLLFSKGLLSQRRASLCIFGGVMALLVYGLLMDSANVFIYQARPTWPMFLASYGLGLPFNLIHAASTAIFLWFLSGPLIEKLERIKVKYGLIE